MKMAFTLGLALLLLSSGGCDQLMPQRQNSNPFHEHGKDCGHEFRNGRWVEAREAAQSASAFNASMDLVEQGGGQTQTLWDKGDEKREAESVRYYQAAIQKYPSNPWAYYYLGKLYSEKKQARVARPHLPLLAAGCFLRCRESRGKISDEMIDSWIVHKYPDYQRITSQRELTPAERKIAWPFTLDSEELEARVADAMSRCADYVALAMRTSAGLSANPGFGKTEGRIDVTRFSSNSAHLELARVVTIERSGGHDYVMVLPFSSVDPSDLSLRFGMTLMFISGAPSELKTLRRMQAELPAKIKTDEALKESKRNDLERGLKLRHKNLIATPLEEIRILEKEVERCDRKLEQTDQTTDEGAQEAVILVKEIKDLRGRIVIRRNGVEADKATYAEAEKEHDKAVRELDSANAASVRGHQEALKRYEEDTYQVALKAHQATGAAAWSSLKKTLATAFE